MNRSGHARAIREFLRCPAGDAWARFLDGSLPIRMQRRFEAHLAGCTDCQASLDRAHVPPSPFPAHVRDDENAWVNTLVDSLRNDTLFEAGGLFGCSSSYEPRIGDEIGRHLLLRGIGRGGMGVVFEAEHRQLGSRVALKMIRRASDESADARRRFRLEARRLAALGHANIARVFDADEHCGRSYFTMELVNGPRLDQAFPPGRAPFADIARAVAKIAEAVHYAHSRGVLHLDLKPANVAMSGKEPKLLDFGLGRATGDSGESAAGGTPGYRAPEQSERHRAPITGKTDVFGLGAILHELLTGARLPDERLCPERLLRDGMPVPPDLEAVCQQCLESDPDRRPANARAVARLLAKHHRASRNDASCRRTASVRGQALSWSALALVACILMGAGVLASKWFGRERELNRLIGHGEFDAGLATARNGNPVAGVEAMFAALRKIDPHSPEGAERCAAAEWWRARMPRKIASIALPEKPRSMFLDVQTGGPRVRLAGRNGLVLWRPPQNSVAAVGMPAFLRGRPQLIADVAKLLTELPDDRRDEFLGTGLNPDGPVANDSPVTAAAALGPGGEFVTATWSPTVALRQWARDGRSIRLLAPTCGFPNHPIMGLCASADGKYIGANTAEGEAWVWECPSGREVMSFGGRNAATAMAFSRDSQRIVVANQQLEVRTLATGETLATMASGSSSESVTSLAVLADDSIAALVVTEHGPVVRRATADLAASEDVSVREVAGKIAQIAASGELLALSERPTPTVELWELPPFRWRSSIKLRAEGRSVLAAAGRCAATVSRTSERPTAGSPMVLDSLCVWPDVSNLGDFRSWGLPEGACGRAVAVHPEGVAVACGGETVRQSVHCAFVTNKHNQWRTLDLIAGLGGHVACLAFSANGKRLLCGLMDSEEIGFLQDCDWRTGRIVSTVRLDGIPVALAALPDGHALVACSSGQLIAWDAGKPAAEVIIANVGFKPHKLAVFSESRAAVYSQTGARALVDLRAGTVLVRAVDAASNIAWAAVCLDRSGASYFGSIGLPNAALATSGSQSGLIVGSGISVADGVAGIEINDVGLIVATPSGRILVQTKHGLRNAPH